MPKPRMAYFEEEDVLHLAISDEPEASSVELEPNITAELNAEGELIGIEILDASTYLRDSILDSVQAKMLRPPVSSTAGSSCGGRRARRRLIRSPAGSGWRAAGRG